MFSFERIEARDRREFYEQLNTYLVGLIEGEDDWLANLCNAASLLYLLVPDINWAGFYLFRDGQLVLGPFQGKPACTRIALGRGVCGTAAQTREIQVVKDVDLFPGHIACDALSKSEIVVPVIKGERLIGVLDIDSPFKARFDDEDARGLKAFVDILNRHIDWPGKFE
ncbi:MAG: GAF domain-containing protein [Clostridiales bacterium]|jgi:GAF domain-containing protein|nr:GAF domain-containing protein [Clostridiales bacterium]